MTTGPTIADLSRVMDAEERRSVGSIRRYAIKVTSQVLWQLVGYKIDAFLETLQCEPFTGIGFYSRPPRDGKPEAIAVFAGGAKSPAAVAMRDERTRVRVVGNLAEGETAVYSGSCVVLVRDGTVEIRSAASPVVEPTVKADTFFTALDLMLTALGPAMAGLTAGPISAPTAAATLAASAAIETFQTAYAAFKTTVTKVQ